MRVVVGRADGGVPALTTIARRDVDVAITAVTWCER